MSDEIKRSPVKSSALVPAPPSDVIMAEDQGTVNIDDRRDSIFKLKLRGKTNQEIADTLKINVKTVARDIDALRAMNRQLFTFDRQELIRENLKGFDDVIERAWAEYESAPKMTMLRLKALDMARVARNDRAKFLQECGFIEVAEKKTEHKLTVDILNRWGDAEFRRSAAKAIVESTFTPQLAAPQHLDEVLKELEAENDQEIIEVPTEPDTAE